VIFENFFLIFEKALHCLSQSAADLDHYGRRQTRSQ